MNKIGIVTVNYNTEKDTLNFLDSLEKINSSGFSLSVVVVDNASRENFSLPKKYKKENIKVINLNKNTGFSGGYNTGIKEVLKENVDYVLVVNNDTILDPEILINLTEVIAKDVRIGVVTPKIYFAKGHEFHKDRYSKEELGKVFWFAGGYMDWANVQSVHRGVDEVDIGQYNKAEEIGFASGCCMLIRRAVLEKVGLFDDNFFLYYEDADLNLRIKKAGYKIYYVPSAVLVHVNAASTGGAGNLLHDYFITRNQMLFGLKYAPLRSKIALVRQSIRLLISGRPKQKQAIKDFYLGRLGKGTFFNK
ncbi:glycosyltransferase family 2 protein [Patescibacteria group bacterium]|nr:glycosyltransferase family 2 protein [Patescibacteria group bacterium]